MAALASLLALLAANGTAQLDCACRRLHSLTGGGRETSEGGSGGEARLSSDYCQSEAYHYLMERCVTLEQPSMAVQAVGRLVQRDWGSPPALAEGDPSLGPPAGVEDCSDALAEIRNLTDDEAGQLWCHTATHCFNSCLAEGVNVTKWTAEALATSGLRGPVVSHLVAVVRRITKTINGGLQCFENHTLMASLPETNITEGQNGIKSELQEFYNYYQLTAQLFPAVVTHLSQLFIPLAFELMDNQINDEQLDGWIKDMEHLRDMLDIKFRGLMQDVRFVTNQIPKYTIEEDDNSPRNFTVRRPLLSDVLLFTREALISFRDDFGGLCEQQHPNTSQVMGLADALYSFYHRNFLFPMQVIVKSVDIIDEEWQLEDQSGAVLSVDTGCLQLLASAVDHPTCPLEDLPADAARRRRDCRAQLWDDMVRRLPHIPVTSYLAYTQRASVNLCLLAWMAANSFGVCEDVLFSMTQSVRDARCYFESPDDTKSCLQSNPTEVICSVSRAILLLKCRDFSSFKPPETCFVNFSTTGWHSDNEGVKWNDGVYKTPGKATGLTLNYKDTLNKATLKYKDFKVDNLKLLETSFVAINIIFRVLAAGIYMYLPQLRNLPGKIFLSFQLTGIAQILCSEILHRMAGVLKLSTAVLIDSSLTLLGCLWLNTFCYQMYACIRRLRLPNDLSPSEASVVFHRQALYALMPWSIVCATCIALESVSKHYVLHSRIVFLVGISGSIAFNFVFLGLVLYTYRHNRKAMKRLKIYSFEDFFSKKQLLFLSVNTIILSGIGVIIRIGFQQAEGIAQYVYYVHIASMMQGPVLFIFFICNDTTLPLLKNRVLAWWSPGTIIPGQELCSTAEMNLAKRRDRECLIAETSL